MNRHDLDWFSLFAGALFAGLGLTFLFNSLGTWSADLSWVFPIVLIVFGIAGVVATIARHNHTGSMPATTPVAAAALTPSAAAATAPDPPSGFGQKPPEHGGELPEPGDD
jgi:hypothetical protein